jgi:hypothetical protein
MVINKLDKFLIPCNLKISTTKTRAMASTGKDQVRIKIIINKK